MCGSVEVSILYIILHLLWVVCVLLISMSPNHLGLVVPEVFFYASKALVHLKGDFIDLTLFGEDARVS